MRSIERSPIGLPIVAGREKTPSILFQQVKGERLKYYMTAGRMSGFEVWPLGEEGGTTIVGCGEDIREVRVSPGCVGIIIIRPESETGYGHFWTTFKTVEQMPSDQVRIWNRRLLNEYPI